MDFIIGLPLSFGFTTTKVFIDRLEKYAHFVALQGKLWQISFMKNVVKLQDMPKTIVFLRGGGNLGEFISTSRNNAGYEIDVSPTEALKKFTEMYFRYLLHIQ